MSVLSDMIKGCSGRESARGEAHGIEYKVVRSRRRTAALVISTDAIVTVRAPWRMPETFIENVVRQKSAWIQKKMLEMQRRPAVRINQFVPGEMFLFLGREYPLRICEVMKGSFYFADEFVLSARETGRARDHFVSWYKKESFRIITARVDYFAAREGFQYQTLRITNARGRWGSCTSLKGLSFSWRLIMAPIDVIDYVVVHELTHLDICNHSPRFWARVRQIYPQTDQCRAWLKKNGSQLDIKES